LHLLRVSDLEKTIKEINEKDFAPNLTKVSKPITTCSDCENLADLFDSRGRVGSNLYLIEAPEDELLHLLKRKYTAYHAFKRLYDTTQIKMQRLIEIINAESENIRFIIRRQPPTMFVR
jgi:recombinational DNA repair protein RecR